MSTTAPTSAASSSSAASGAPAAASSTASAADIEQAPESVQMTDEEELTAAQDKDVSDSGKLKMLMGVLKKMVGVKDMAAVRLSLPANLLEPVPNLEYWNYLDRGDIFASIGELEDPLDRMVQTLRFTFTKELKFVHGKICKPYNSILGEHFRCHWDIQAMQTTAEGDLIPTQNVNVANPTPLPLIGSGPSKLRGGKTSRPSSIRETTGPSPSTPVAESGVASATPERKKPSTLSRIMSVAKVQKTSSPSGSSPAAATSPGGATASSKSSTKSPKLSASGAGEDNKLASNVDRLSISSAKGSKEGGNRSGHRRITFITEQVSHHPPISSFFVECKETGVQLCGVDQLSAKFTGTSIRVYPGEANKGIFVKLTEDAPAGAHLAGEEYQITHPTASLNGLLRGALWVAICDPIFITCRGGSRDGDNGKRLRTVIEYKDESWLSKAKYALEGVIYEYDASKGEDTVDEFKTVKEVPSDRVVGTIEGSWKGKITWKKKGDKESRLLINLDEVEPLPKTVRPLSSQDEMESRKIWGTVTTAIVTKDYAGATKNKQQIEQAQREKAANRKRKGEEFVPRYFEVDIADGRPRLTTEGRSAIDAEAQLIGYGKGENVAEEDKRQAEKAAMGKTGGAEPRTDKSDEAGDDGDADSFISADEN